MHVQQLDIARFRHLSDAHIGPLPPPGPNSEVIVLAGPNGGGKSSILDLIGFGLSTTWGWTWNTSRNLPDSSFEIRFALSDADADLIAAAVASDPAIDPNGVSQTLLDQRSYVRGFNYPPGEYSANPGLNDQLHQLTSRVLADHTRAMYLRSDRYFTRQNYPRNRIFESQKRLQSSYWRSMAFTLTQQQYEDQVEFLIEQIYNYPRLVGAHELRRQAGANEDPPPDPVAPYENLFQVLFPQYGLIRPTSEIPPDQLTICLPSGQEVPFADLSSGEQETFFILSFFERHAIQNSIVLIDEPELHLHPELVRRMLKIMMRLKPHNQIWLATHNAELIDEAGTDRTYFVYRPTPNADGTTIRASDDQGYISQLRALFGYSGYVGLARRLVFIEGDASSTDRRILINLFPDVAEQIRFVPVGSGETVVHVNRAILSILATNLGNCDFFLIRDRDFLSDEAVNSLLQQAEGRIFVLDRHEIENYLIDYPTIAEVVARLRPDNALTPDQVEARLNDIARRSAGDLLRDRVAARLNVRFRAKDCSIGRFETDLPPFSGPLIITVLPEPTA